MIFLNKKNSKGGYSLIEILIGLGLLTLGISLTAVVVFDSQNVLIDRENTSIAKTLAKEGVVGTSAIIKNNWYGITDGTYGLTFSNGAWQFSGTSDTQDIFTRSINVAINGQRDERKVTSTVTWQASLLRPQKKVEVVTLIANWPTVLDTGDDNGGGGLTGDWLHPMTLGTIDLGPGNSTTDLDVKNKIVYISAIASSAAKPDFFIINATTGQTPSIIASLETGVGLNALDVAGTYAYLAQNDITNQLQIIDVNNIYSPGINSLFTLPGVSGTGAVGNSIYYYSKKIYIGTKNATGPEFHVIDVSNPNVPYELGSYEVGADVNKIVINNNKAYLATSNDTKELMVLNVSDPSNITSLGSYNNTGNEDGKSVFIVNNTAYLGIGGGTSDFRILNVSNPASITSYSVVNAFSSSVNDIYVRDTLAFLATDNANNEFQVWNISNLSVPTNWSTFNFPQVANSVDYEDNLVYVGVRSNDAFRIITSSP